MTSFFVALALGQMFPRIRWPLLLIATFSASTRIALLAHYPSDVIAGFALAFTGVWTAQRILGPAWFDPLLTAKSTTKVAPQPSPGAV